MTTANLIEFDETESIDVHGRNQVLEKDLPVHRWYRFVLSFPPHLVRHYLRQFGIGKGQVVLDPFCGTGTTLVECKKLGVQSVGIEPNPVAHFASFVKTSWSAPPRDLIDHASSVAEAANAVLREEGVASDYNHSNDANSTIPLTSFLKLPEAQTKLLIRDSISPLPLHRTIRLLDAIQQRSHPVFSDYERLALAAALVNGIGNLRFGPEVGVGPEKTDAPVIDCWLENVRSIASDLAAMREFPPAHVQVIKGDSRSIEETLAEESVDAVITSPPYPNEKDYTRTTRLESVLLGFLKNRQDLQALKKKLVKSNTRGVYKEDDDDRVVSALPGIRDLADRIEQERLRLNKTSGFERLYARVAKLYFGGMTRHLDQLRHVLKPGAHLAYVVGDQASYLRVMIRTGEQLAEIARMLGYQVIGRDLFRTRFSTATKHHLREEVLILRWPGWGLS